MTSKHTRNSRLTPEEMLTRRRRKALARLGHPLAERHSGMVYASTAARLLGVTTNALTKLIEPDELVTNPHYKSGPPAALFDPIRLAKLLGTTKLRNAVACRGKKRPHDYSSSFARRYPDTSTAIPTAADYMWNLNRYAKHGRCTTEHRENIYELKNDFLQFLAEKGYLTGVGTHSIHQPAKSFKCRSCGGDGCEHCDLTGTSRELPERSLDFAVLQYTVGDRIYTWHQPADEMIWSPPDGVKELETGRWEPGCERPLSLSSRKFAEAKALVKWVMEGGPPERGKQPPAEKPAA